MRVFRAMEAGETVGADLAMQAWAAKFALWRLQKRLTQTVQTGQTASEALTPHMNAGMEDEHAEA